MTEGRWARCTVCNARRLKTNFDFWTTSKCAGAPEGRDLKASAARLKRSREDDTMQGPRQHERVSPFKKAKIAMEQRAEIAKRKKRDRESLKETWRTLLQNSVADLTPLPRGPEIETHSSHTLIACGG